MQPWSGTLAGRLDEHVIDSGELRGNPLGDPHERPLWVYVPPGYDDEPDRRYPSIYVIQGYTGHLEMWRNRTPYRQPFTETADEMFARPETPPAIVVYVDAWTAYGGSQFVDSPRTPSAGSARCLCRSTTGWSRRDGARTTPPARCGRRGRASRGSGA